MPCRARWCSETEELTTGSANPVDGRSRLASPVAMAVASAEPDWTLIVVPAVIRYCALDGLHDGRLGHHAVGHGWRGRRGRRGHTAEGGAAEPIVSSAATTTVTRRSRCPDSPMRMAALQDRCWSSLYRSTLSYLGRYRPVRGIVSSCRPPSATDVSGRFDRVKPSPPAHRHAHAIGSNREQSVIDEGQLIAGHYRLLERIGSGSMGVVWRARDERLERVVAVKQLLTQTGLTDEHEGGRPAAALREARIAARLHHPNAIVVFDVPARRRPVPVDGVHVTSKSMARASRAG